MSYDPTLPTPRDRVRFTLADTAEPPLRTDVEYDALITLYGETEATVRMAESLASEYAQNPSSVNVGGVAVSYSTLVQNWQAIAKKYGEGLAATRLTTGGSGTLDRGEMTVVRKAEYRRPEDWYPEGGW